MTPDMSRLGWTDEMTKLREENARLRARLAQVVEALEGISVADGANHAGVLARAALAAAKGGE